MLLSFPLALPEPHRHFSKLLPQEKESCSFRLSHGTIILSGLMTFHVRMHAREVKSKGFADLIDSNNHPGSGLAISGD